ncbi:MAG: RNA polymerase sigma factor [Lachnospiraceae bacterium]|nr:RNA polymerase sigma factor [Lachnospiraceae bacterium]
MTYEQAVKLAKKKEEAGYRFLYESTYWDKYYIALKYMKNEEDALDVLQDAYMKAFDKLDTLYEGEKFPAWLGMIVANTAKNALAKKKLVLFSEMYTENEGGDAPEYQIEDENIENQPELSYTKEETRELVQQLIDSLSEEQRLCILMFHIEDMSIREIAEALDCPENTVKSRLNYGRKNLKTKAEELEKQGYKLYGVAPLPLLLYLLRMEGAAYLPKAGIAEMLTYQKFMSCFNRHSLSANVVPSEGDCLANQEANTAGKAVKQVFIHTATGKIMVAIVATIIAVGVIIAVIQNKPSEDSSATIAENSEKNTQEISEADGTDGNAQTTVEQITETPKTDEDILVSDEDYSNLTGLTKEELTAMLVYAPSKYSGGGMTDEDIETFLMHLLFANAMHINLEETTTADYQTQWNTEVINKMLSALELPVMTDENAAYWAEKGFQVSGTTVMQYAATANEYCIGEISAADYNSKEMYVTYTVTTKISHNDERGTEEINDERTAIFVPNVNGKYVLSKIISGVVTIGDNEQGNDTKQSEVKDWKSAYRAVLNDPVSWLRDKQNVDGSLLSGLSNYQYSLFDMNQDGTPELIISAWTSENFVDWFFCTYSNADGAYMIANQEWNFRQSMVICNNQLAWFYYDGFSPDVSITSINMTMVKIENSGEIYSGNMESAPETEQMECCPIGDVSAIERY